MYGCNHGRVTRQPDVVVRDPAGVQDVVDGLASLARVLLDITARTLAALDVDVTLPQYRTLVMLSWCGPRRTGDLAAELGVHASTVTRTCDRLIRRGLVERNHRQQDRRVAWLALTEQGKWLLGEMMRRRTREIQRLVEATTLDHPESLARCLDALVTVSGEISEPEWWRRWARSTEID